MKITSMEKRPNIPKMALKWENIEYLLSYSVILRILAKFRFTRYISRQSINGRFIFPGSITGVKLHDIPTASSGQEWKIRTGEDFSPPGGHRPEGGKKIFRGANFPYLPNADWRNDNLTWLYLIYVANF